MGTLGRNGKSDKHKKSDKNQVVFSITVLKVVTGTPASSYFGNFETRRGKDISRFIFFPHFDTIINSILEK